MRITILCTLLFIGACQCTVAQSNLLRKTDWTVAEVKEWVTENGNHSTWKGMLLYKGTDSTKHHFISRVMDEFVFFNIDRATIDLKDIRPYRITSSAPLGYYYVDALKNFEKIKDY